jgi:hypothetical protein
MATREEVEHHRTHLMLLKRGQRWTRTPLALRHRFTAAKRTPVQPPAETYDFQSLEVTEMLQVQTDEGMLRHCYRGMGDPMSCGNLSPLVV